MKKPNLINFNRIGDSNLGFISVAEVEDLVPFKIQRVYWTYFTPENVERGNHAHKELEQIIIAVNGKINFTLINKQGNKQTFVLDKPDKGVYIPNGYWREIKFSHNAVLLCIASEKYKEEDYIRNYNDFLNDKYI